MKPTVSCEMKTSRTTNHLLRATAFVWAVFSAGATCSEAIASSCNGNGATKKIRFEKGSECWKYHGTAVTFVGKFSRGQKVAVKMSGVLEELGANGQTTSSIEARDPYVTGPGEFYAGGNFEESGILRFLVPKNGTYTITFSPCAMQGNMGDVLICAK